MLKLNVDKLRKVLPACNGFQTGAPLVSSDGILHARLSASVGELCEMETGDGDRLPCEVIGFRGRDTQLMPLRQAVGISPGRYVFATGRPLEIPLGTDLLGRVVNGMGNPIDEAGPLTTALRGSVHAQPPASLSRPPISEPFVTGQRVIDGLMTIGKGQRIALFAESGVGKSTLLGNIARFAQCSVNVIALLGERSREVRPFLDRCLGPDGLRKSVVVVSTAEEPPMMRVKAAQTAMRIAEFFRDRGDETLMLCDSITRLGMAQREVGLALGEPPTARGYTPSVFRVLSDLLERMGTSEHASITAVVTVLTESADHDDPLAEAVRSVVDGHIVMDRRLAEKNHYPAVNVSRSLSRLFDDITSSEHRAFAKFLRTSISQYDDVADLIRLGAYRRGSSQEIDTLVDRMPHINQFLRQESGTFVPLAETLQGMRKIASTSHH